MKKRGTNGADEISGSFKADTIRGLDGDDILHGNGGYDSIYGGRGNDTIDVTFGGKLFSGDAGDDYFNVVGLSFGGGTVAVDGGSGIDTFDASSVAGGSDYLYFTDNGTDQSIAVGDYVISGVEVIHGGFGRNWFDLQNQIVRTTVYGGEQDDVFIPSFNAENAPTFNGNNVMYGLGGNDFFAMRYAAEAYGGNGDDTFSFWFNARSSVDGGDGIDTIVLTNFGSVNLKTGILNLVNATSYATGVENVIGSAGDDILTGNSTANSLSGEGGNDHLNGGAGSDILIGGAGIDVLTGGAGADHFQFMDSDMLSTDPNQADEITDFHHADRDRIELNGIDANTLKAGDQRFQFIGTSAFTGHAGELHYAVVDGSAFVSGDTNGDGIGDFTIKLDGVTELVSTDFRF